MDASKHGDLSQAQDALQKKADVNGAVSGGTPLYYAATNHHPDIVNLLVHSGANLNAQHDDTGWTPLMAATDDPDIEGLLIAAGANVNIKGRSGDTALEIAAMNNRVATVKMLISAGEPVNERGAMGTPLYWAVQGGSIDLVKTLLDAGASPNGAPGDRVTPLSMARFKHYDEIVAALENRGASG